MRYKIKETWRVLGQIEKYETPVKNLKEVKRWIEDWIKTWKENAEDNGYTFLGFKTDYKTFCKLRIKTGQLLGDDLIDTFSLIVNNN